MSNGSYFRFNDVDDDDDDDDDDVYDKMKSKYPSDHGKINNSADNTLPSLAHTG